MDPRVSFVKRKILASGTDDWVAAVEASFAARQAAYGDHLRDSFPDDKTMDVSQLGALRDEWTASQERRTLYLVVQAVKELIRDGLAQIGYTVDEGFEPWKGSPSEIEARIDAVVDAADFPLRPGDLFWLRNTSRGDSAADAYDSMSPL